MSVLVITGTDTGVGKTVATAALAAAARAAGLDVAVCKPVQTGTDDGDDDLAEVSRLAGVGALYGAWRYPEALGPVAAAERAGMTLPTRAELVASVRVADGADQLTLVEGAGGLLVELGTDGVTLRDVAAELSAPVLVVVAPGLGTLNHTALTMEALAMRGVSCAGLVIGAWPRQPDTAASGNVDALRRMAPLRAVLPAGAATLDPADFEAVSMAAFDRDWITGLL
jgi:dethiobiotin synthetase